MRQNKKKYAHEKRKRMLKTIRKKHLKKINDSHHQSVPRASLYALSLVPKLALERYIKVIHGIGLTLTCPGAPRLSFQSETNWRFLPWLLRMLAFLFIIMKIEKVSFFCGNQMRAYLSFGQYNYSCRWNLIK